MSPLLFWIVLVSPFLLFPAAKRLKIAPLWAFAVYLLEWLGWEFYLRTMHPELWMRADLFLSVPALVGALAYAFRSRPVAAPTAETRPGSGPPEGWEAAPSREGGVDLRAAKDKKVRAVVLALLWAVAAGWTARALIALWVYLVLSQKSPPVLAAAIGIFLILLALWCTFGDDVWHIETDCVERRIGIGAWQWTRRCCDAELQVVSHPYYGRAKFRAERIYRLYAVAGGVRHFLLEPHRLFEAGKPEAQALASFFSAHTGWRVRDIVHEDSL